MGTSVKLSKRAIKELYLVPKHIAVKLKSWVELVETNGIISARKTPGYHDEPLYSPREGQRSIRLSRSYRAFNKIQRNVKTETIIVLEVNKHDY